MPNPDPKKTKSARNRQFALYGVLIVVALFTLFAPTLFYKPPQAELRAGKQSVALEIASSPAAQAKGLSGRASMASDHGMLFVFAHPAATCFWMKDMQFPLDIVWLNNSKQIIHVEPNVSPRSYPKSFCPSKPAKYVIELHAGRAAQLGLRVGLTASF